MEALHFLRPYWLLALLPLVVILWSLRFQQRQGGAWTQVCDPQLLPYLLVSGVAQQSRYKILLVALAWIIMVVALAGPAWQKLPQPVFRNQAATIVLLDLSYSMDATDVKPSRLTRAKHKLLDLLQLQKDQQMGLIGYAGDAHIVSPLTDDADTIAALIPGLSTNIMPVPGSQLSEAVQLGLQLLGQSGIRNKGHMIVISDGVDDALAKDTAREVATKGHRLSVLAVGTLQGAPIPMQKGGFLKDQAGAIVMAPLQPVSLQEIATLGGGVFTQTSTNDQDLKRLVAAAFTPDKGRLVEQQFTDRWQEEGPWLLPLLLLLLLFAFRKGWQFAALLLFIIPAPESAQAFEWQKLWKNDNQLAFEKLQQGDHQQAAQMFKDEQWQAIAKYRANNYTDAATLFSQQGDAVADYNLGNTLARAGKLAEAVDAYERALEKHPGHEDAEFNLELVKKLMQDQQQQNNDSDQQSSDQQQSQQDQSQDGAQSSDQQQSQQDQQSSENNEQQQDSSQSDQSQQTPQPQQAQTEQSESSEQQSQPSDQKESTEPTESEQQSMQAQQQNEQPEGEQEQASAQTAQIQPPSEEQQAMEQWLQKIPDDPGGLLRRKFEFEHQRRGNRNPVGAKTW